MFLVFFIGVCTAMGGPELGWPAGTAGFDEKYVEVKSYDFEKKGMQGDNDLVVVGEKEWGTNPRNIFKYLLLRCGYR